MLKPTVRSATRTTGKLVALALAVLLGCLGTTSCGTEASAATSLNSELARGGQQALTAASVTLPANALPAAASPMCSRCG